MAILVIRIKATADPQWEWRVFDRHHPPPILCDNRSDRKTMLGEFAVKQVSHLLSRRMAVIDAVINQVDVSEYHVRLHGN